MAPQPMMHTRFIGSAGVSPAVRRASRPPIGPPGRRRYILRRHRARLHPRLFAFARLLHQMEDSVAVVEGVINDDAFSNSASCSAAESVCTGAAPPSPMPL